MKQMRGYVGALAVLIMAGGVAGPRAALAQSHEGEESISLYGYRDHTGLYSHIALGVGYGGVSANYDYDPGSRDVTQSGISQIYDFSIGASVLPRFALHFSLFGFDVYSSKFSRRVDHPTGIDPRDVDGGATVTGIGGGATYYFPANVFVGGSAGLGLASAVNEYDNVVRLDPGFAAQVRAGYEWWIGSSWGIGVAAAAAYCVAKRGPSAGDERWQGLAGGLLFSATMN